jgi:excisionase family DNA binding protein
VGKPEGATETVANDVYLAILRYSSPVRQPQKGLLMSMTARSSYAKQGNAPRAAKSRDGAERSGLAGSGGPPSRSAARAGQAAELMLSPAEIAERVGVSIDAVRRAIRSGQLPASKVFGRVRVHPRDLERYIADHAMLPAGAVGDHLTAGRRAPAPLRGSLRAQL